MKYYCIRGSTINTISFGVLPALMSFVCVCAESDEAIVYSAVRTEDVSNGPIIIKEKEKKVKDERYRCSSLSPSWFTATATH